MACKTCKEWEKEANRLKDIAKRLHEANERNKAVARELSIKLAQYYPQAPENIEERIL